MKFPDSSHLSSPLSSHNKLHKMATATTTGIEIPDAPMEGNAHREAMSMADKLQNGIEGDLDGHQDPDAQATVTDFLDFTEYLPSDMARSLTLICNLDQTYLEASKNVHDLTKIYGQLPSLPDSERQDATELRADVSRNLSEAVTARTLSYEEACRLKENVDRHFNRLKNIHAKLQKMAETYPPSRVNSPEPQQSKSPQAARTAPKVTLRLDGSKAAELVHRNRTPRITVPGEVMAPFELDYDSYGSFSDSELTDDEGGHSRTQTPGVGTSKPRSIKLNVIPKTPKEKVPKPNRIPGVGTNVHSQVAGISTSNALAKLKPPAIDAKPGDPDAPWLKLTAWELAKLRKKMKKNAVWNPSDTMIARELQSKGRAIEDYKRHNEERVAAGQPPLDLLPQMMNAASARRVLEEGEISVDAWNKGELSNRGMKLNEAKKLKKEIEKKAAIEESMANGLSTTEDSAPIKDAFTVTAYPVKITLAKDVAIGENHIEEFDISSKDTPAKGAPAKPASAKPKSHKKASAKEIKEAKEAKESKDVTNGSKDELPVETPTEHTHLLSSLEGIKERIKGVTSGLPVSAAEKGGEIQGTTPKKQPAKTSKKRKARDSTADTDISKASKASKIEGPVPGSSLRVERRSATETPAPTSQPSSGASGIAIPLAPPGPTSSRTNVRRSTPASAGLVVEHEPIVVPDLVPLSATQQKSLIPAEPAKVPESETLNGTAQASGSPLEPQQEAKKEIVKEPPKKKETVKERREREKKEKEAKKEKEKEAKKPAAPAARNRRKASIAPATPAPEVATLPARRNASRPSSRNGKASSHEPLPPATNQRPRRSSTAHNTPAPEPRAPSKRLEAKRPPPGQVTAGPDSASVSVSKRKAAPRKRAAPKKQKEEGKEAVLEDMVELDDEGNVIDPSEPRYCKCNKVSYGAMIGCESEKELGRVVSFCFVYCLVPFD